MAHLPHADGSWLPGFATAIAVAFAAGADLKAQDAGRPPWPARVAGHAPVEPGEHPRLLFRRSDLPALRARVRTPAGQAILRRLRETLGGGETMPELRNGFSPRPTSTLFPAPAQLATLR